MAFNLALYVVPLSLARTREKLDDRFAAWAERRRQESMAIRVSGPTMVPGTDYEVWLFETPNQIISVLLDDLALHVRAVVALRLNGEAGRGIAQVYSRDAPLRETRAERSEEIEALAASALGAFVGPIDVRPGWLAPWLAEHESTAEVRVVRWHRERTKTLAWPDGYAAPTEEDWRLFEGIYDKSLNVRTFRD